MAWYIRAPSCEHVIHMTHVLLVTVTTILKHVARDNIFIRGMQYPRSKCAHVYVRLDQATVVTKYKSASCIASRLLMKKDQMWYLSFFHSWTLSHSLPARVL